MRNRERFLEKLHYIHLEPGKAGIVRATQRLALEQLSSTRDQQRRTDRIEFEWNARKRERAAAHLCAAVELPHSSQNKT